MSRIRLNNLEHEVDKRLFEGETCLAVMVDSLAYARLRKESRRNKDCSVKECLNVFEMIIKRHDKYFATIEEIGKRGGYFLGLMWGNLPILCARGLEKDSIYVVKINEEKYEQLMSQIELG